MSHPHPKDGAIRPEVLDFARSVQSLVARAQSNELTIEEAARVTECLGKIDAILQLEQTLRSLPSAPRPHGELHNHLKLDGVDGTSMEPS